MHCYPLKNTHKTQTAGRRGVGVEESLTNIPLKIYLKISC